MKHLLHSGAAILIASLISGCATHVSMIGPARPPISPAAVRIYENPPRHYQQIAIINSSAGTTWLFPDRGSPDEAIADLRREAAALGDNGHKSCNTFCAFSTSSGRKIIKPLVEFSVAAM